MSDCRHIERWTFYLKKTSEQFEVLLKLCNLQTAKCPVSPRRASNQGRQARGGDGSMGITRWPWCGLRYTRERCLANERELLDGILGGRFLFTGKAILFLTETRKMSCSWQ